MLSSFTKYLYLTLLVSNICFAGALRGHSAHNQNIIVRSLDTIGTQEHNIFRRQEGDAGSNNNDGTSDAGNGNDGTSDAGGNNYNGTSDVGGNNNDGTSDAGGNNYDGTSDAGGNNNDGTSDAGDGNDGTSDAGGNNNDGQTQTTDAPSDPPSTSAPTPTTDAPSDPPSTSAPTPTAGAPVSLPTAVTPNSGGPTFTGAPYKASLTLDAPVGTLVVTITAADLDGVVFGLNTQSSARTRRATESPPFKIDASTGEVTTMELLDSDVDSYTLTVTATDSGAPPMVSTETLTVTVVASSNTFQGAGGEGNASSTNSSSMVSVLGLVIVAVILVLFVIMFVRRQKRNKDTGVEVDEIPVVFTRTACVQSPMYTQDFASAESESYSYSGSYESPISGLDDNYACVNDIEYSLGQAQKKKKGASSNPLYELADSELNTEHFRAHPSSVEYDIGTDNTNPLYDLGSSAAYSATSKCTVDQNSVAHDAGTGTSNTKEMQLYDLAGTENQSSTPFYDMGNSNALYATPPGHLAEPDREGYLMIGKDAEEPNVTYDLATIPSKDERDMIHKVPNIFTLTKPLRNSRDADNASHVYDLGTNANNANIYDIAASDDL